MPNDGKFVAQLVAKGVNGVGALFKFVEYGYICFVPNDMPLQFEKKSRFL